MAQRQLAAYGFENIYIWKGIFAISWALVRGSLCVFFEDNIGCFMYLPPLGERLDPEALRECFALMDSRNKNQEVSRIENISAGDIGEYKKFGYRLYEKPGEYLCQRSALAGLAGSRYKSKRAAANYFTKNYCSVYRGYVAADEAGCLRLYRGWVAGRKRQNPDPLYQGMLQDSEKCLRLALADYPSLNLAGKVVAIDGQIKAFTFGFRLSRDTFCVLYEITDLKVKGLAQFIFMRFCRDLEPCKYINLMDDSGLENLKKVKLSYHPLKIIPAYIARKDA